MPDELLKRLERMREAKDDPSAMSLMALDFFLEVQPDSDSLRNAINAVAIPHWFDAASLAQLLNIGHESVAQQVWKQLDALPMVEKFLGFGPTARNVHEVTRLALRRDLLKTNPDKFRELSARALLALGEDQTPNFIVERLYHRFVVNPEQAITECEMLTRNWVNGAWPEVRELLRGALEELEQTNILAGAARCAALVAVCWIYYMRGELRKVANFVHIALHLAEDTKSPSLIAHANCLLGDIQALEGDLDGAAILYRKAHAIEESLVATEPESLIRRFDLGIIKDRIGSTRYVQGHLVEALHYYEEALQIARWLSFSEPENLVWKRTLLLSHDKVATVLKAEGYLGKALVALQEGHKLAEILVNRDSCNTEYQLQLGNSFAEIGSIYMAQGHFSKAQEMFDRNLQIAIQIAESDPTNLGWQQNLGNAYSRTGEVFREQDQVDNALAAFQKYFEISLTLSQLDPTNTAYLHALGASYNRIGGTLIRSQKFVEGIAAMQASREHAEYLASLDPTNTRWKLNTAIAYGEIGATLTKVKASKDALDALRRSTSIIEELVRHDASNADWQAALSYIYLQSARYYEVQHQYGIAYSFRQKSLRIKRYLAHIDPDNLRLQHQIALELSNIAVLEATRNKRRQATTYSDEAKKLFSVLQEARTEHKQWQNDYEREMQHLDKISR